jgi:hypothetical protein
MVKVYARDLRVDIPALPKQVANRHALWGNQAFQSAQQQVVGLGQAIPADEPHVV